MWNVDEQGYHIEYQALNALGKRLIRQLYTEDKAFILNENNKCNPLDLGWTGIYVLTHQGAIHITDEEQHFLQLPPRYILNMSISNSSSLTNYCDFHIKVIDNNGISTEYFRRIGSYLIVGEKKYILPPSLYDLFEKIEEHNHLNQVLNRKETDRITIKENNYSLAGHLQVMSKEIPLSLSETIISREVVIPDTMQIYLANNGDNTYRFELRFKNSEIDEDLNERLYGRGAFGDRNKRYAFSKSQHDVLLKIRKMGNSFSKERAEIIASNPEAVFGELNATVDISQISLSDRVIGITDFVFKPIHIDAMQNDWVEDGFKGLQISKNEKDVSSTSPSSENNVKVLDILDNTDESSLYIEKNLNKRLFHSKQLSVLRENIILKNYQLSGVEKLQNIWIDGSKGALLADDMGLGKTLQTLTFAAWSYEQQVRLGGAHKPILVVSPVSLLQNWYDEYIKFIDSSKGLAQPFILYGNALRELKVSEPPQELVKKYGITNLEDIANNKFINTEQLGQYPLVITNYETVRDYQLSLALVDWSLIILDEAQKIKSPDSRISRAVRGMNYNFGLAITGTPVENSWIDLWTILDFCSPNELGVLQEFNKSFIKPVADSGGSFEVLEEKANVLKSIIDPILIRRLKADVLDELPKKRIEKLRIPMGEEQWRFYRSVALRDGRIPLDSDTALSIIQKLKAISIHPYLSRTQIELERIQVGQLVEVSPKLQELIRILKSIQGRSEKALIFIRDKKMQSIVLRILEGEFSLAILPVINGEVPGQRRKQIVDDFNHTYGFNVLLLSPEAGGVGLNITSANHVIHLSREWNPAKEDQATDRAYRIGQDKEVTVYHLLHTALEEGVKTFDEVLDALLDRKRNLSERVLAPAPISDRDGMNLVNEVLINPSTIEVNRNISFKDIRYNEREKLVTLVRELLQLEEIDLVTRPRNSLVDLAYVVDGHLRLMIIVTDDYLPVIKNQIGLALIQESWFTTYEKPVVKEVCVAGSLDVDRVRQELGYEVNDIWDIQNLDGILDAHNEYIQNLL